MTFHSGPHGELSVAWRLRHPGRKGSMRDGFLSVHSSFNEGLRRAQVDPDPGQGSHYIKAKKKGLRPKPDDGLNRAFEGARLETVWKQGPSSWDGDWVRPVLHFN